MIWVEISILQKFPNLCSFWGLRYLECSPSINIPMVAAIGIEKIMPTRAVPIPPMAYPNDPPTSRAKITTTDEIPTARFITIGTRKFPSRNCVIPTMASPINRALHEISIPISPTRM